MPQFSGEGIRTSFWFPLLARYDSFWREHLPDLQGWAGLLQPHGHPTPHVVESACVTRWPAEGAVASLKHDPDSGSRGVCPFTVYSANNLSPRLLGVRPFVLQYGKVVVSYLLGHSSGVGDFEWVNESL
jgi:hypothetical protein